MSRSRLTVISLASLVATALLGLAVSRGFNPFNLEPSYLGVAPYQQNAVNRWTEIAELFAAPVIGVVFVASVVYGAFRRVLLRVAVMAGFAALTFLVSEQIAKPLIGQRLDGELTFPSGNVTAVCATALAMWIALYPVLGKSARIVTFVGVVGWTLLMAFAVVGAVWHTPLDCVGSILLSIGIVTAGGAVLGSKPPKRRDAPPGPVESARVLTG